MALRGNSVGRRSRRTHDGYRLNGEKLEWASYESRWRLPQEEDTRRRLEEWISNGSKKERLVLGQELEEETEVVPK